MSRVGKIGSVLLLLAAMLAVAACGGPASASPSSGGGGAAATQVQLTLTEFAVSPKEVRVPGGASVALVVTNRGSLPHDLHVDGYDVGTKLLPPGQSETLRIQADKKGTFPMYCTVPGHKDSGMVAQLTVQ